MKLVMHGALRDFFDREIQREYHNEKNIADMLGALQKENESAKNILKATRVANDESVLPESTPLLDQAVYHLMPPPGGG